MSIYYICFLLTFGDRDQNWHSNTISSEFSTVQQHFIRIYTNHVTMLMSNFILFTFFLEYFIYKLFNVSNTLNDVVNAVKNLFDSISSIISFIYLFFKIKSFNTSECCRESQNALNSNVHKNLVKFIHIWFLQFDH